MPNKLTQTKIKNNFLEALQLKTAGNISQACKLVGRSRQAINEWRKNDSSFDTSVQNAVADGKENLADLAEECLKRKVEDGDTTAIIFTLKSLRRGYYGEQREAQEAKEKLEKVNGIFEEPRTPEQALNQLQVYLKFSYYKALEFNVLNNDQKQLYTQLYELLKSGTGTIK